MQSPIKEAYTIFYFTNKFLHTGIYQGKNKNNTYFEGWYYKIVCREQKLSFAVIPGISRGIDKSCHAFIQLLINSDKTYYFTYKADEFSYAEDKFFIKIGDSQFSKDKIILHLQNSEVSIHGEFYFYDQIPWNTKEIGKITGTMGIFRLLPFLECYHEVISMRHAVKGYLGINGSIKNISHGIGYMEKDWGHSFPSAWIWAQSNCFDENGEEFSMMLSVARIPFLHQNFRGFLGCVYYKGQIHHFSTYLGTKLELSNSELGNIRIKMEDKNYQFITTINTSNIKSSLASPKKGVMCEKVDESINATVLVQFTQRELGMPKVLFSGQGKYSGVEVSKYHLL